MKILVLESKDAFIQQTFYPEYVKAALAECGEVTYAQYTREEAAAHLAGVDVLFGVWGMPVLDAEFLAKADRLKMICYVAGSVADFMTEEVPKRGIHMLCANKLFARSVAEGTIGYMLLSQRRLIPLIEDTKANGWGKVPYTDGLRFKTIGLIGFGQIVKYLSKMLQAFDCKVKICSDWYHESDIPEYGAEKCELDEIFRTCDIVSLHESLRDDTYHMIDRRYFSMMKQDALFLNTARGPIIVEEDLAEAARSGKIRAVLDVYEREPLPMDSCLRGIDNVILIPHKGGPTVDIRQHCTMALIGDLKKYMQDPNAVLEHEVPWSYAKNMTHSGKNLTINKK